MSATWAMPKLDRRVKILARSLCEHVDIPPEVSDMIAGHFDKAHILVISTLSVHLHAQANAIIYHDIAIDFDDAARLVEPKTAVLFFRTLLTSRTAAEDVRHMAFIGDPLSDWRRDELIEHYRELLAVEPCLRGKLPPTFLFDLSVLLPEEIEMYKNEIANPIRVTRYSCDGIPLPDLCIILIVLAKQLQHLQVNSDYIRYPRFRRALRTIVESGGLRFLESTDLCPDLKYSLGRELHAVRDWDDALLTPFLAPAATSVHVILTLQQKSVSQLSVSSITRLELSHLQLGKFDLNGLLAATPKLRYLEYHASIDYPWHNSLSRDGRGEQQSSGLGPLFDALHHISATLECLLASERYIEDSPAMEDSRFGPVSAPVFRQREELSQLRRLHTLSIPYASLLGWRSREGRKWDWDKILPASLCHVTWTDHLSEHFWAEDYTAWTDDSLMPVIESLVKWLDIPKQRREAEPHKPSFELLLVEADEQLNEPLREAVAQLCEDHAVACTIGKRHKEKRELAPWTSAAGWRLGARARGGVRNAVDREGTQTTATQRAHPRRRHG